MSITKITDYMKLSKEDRQKHIDLSTECQFHYFERDHNQKNKKAGDLYSKSKQKAKAKKELLKELRIEEFGGCKIHVCHLCNCNSYTDKVCINPSHLYFGTAKENINDIPFEIRQKGGKAGGKKTAENMTKEQLSERGKKAGKKCAELGKTGFQQIVACPHCDKTGTIVNMKRWHFDNCKHKPVSTISPYISIIAPETVSTNLE